MAPLTWKLLLATLASGHQCIQSENCEDQTALLQSHLASHKSQLGGTAEMLNFPKITSLTDPSKRKLALSQFENTALELAENKAGVTPLVVQVCNETSELLRDTVMGAIMSEHDTDEAMLNAALAAFESAEALRLGFVADIEAAINAVYGEGGLIDQHLQCRTSESQECVDCGECRIDCEATVETCDELEAELRLKYVDVISTVTTAAYCDENSHIHPPQEQTIVTMAEHHQNKEKMEAYIAALAAYESCEETESTHCNSCPHDALTCTHGLEGCPCLNHTQTRTDCNTLQLSLQQAQCESRHEVSGYLNLYNQAYDGAAMRFDSVETQVRVMEADRKVEWDTLERVICLLMTLSVEEDGAASSVETADAIANCRTMDVDVNHLTINYPVPDAKGELADLPHDPCGDDFNQDAYNDLPPFCAGNVELQQEFEHGLSTECECMAEAPAPEAVGFPYSLGPYLLFDTGFALDSPDGFQMNAIASTWQATWQGRSFNGRLSPFAAVTLEGVDAAFGLAGDQVVDQVAWCYPEGHEHENEERMALAVGETYTEDMASRFLRTGGFVYRNAAGSVVALKEISHADPALTVSQAPELTLTFGDPQGITEDQANHACPGGLADVTTQSLLESGAETYCWDKSGTLSICPNGCFHYKVGGAYLAFPVITDGAHLLPDHYAPTDQQGATVASMITGVLAATNAPSAED